MPDIVPNPVFARALLVANKMAISRWGSPAQNESTQEPGLIGASDNSSKFKSSPWISCQNSFRILKGMPMNSLLHRNIKGNIPSPAVSATELLKTISISSANSFLNLDGYKTSDLEYTVVMSRVIKFMMDFLMSFVLPC